MYCNIFFLEDSNNPKQLFNKSFCWDPPILLAAQVATEDFVDVFLGFELLAPHGQKRFFAKFAFQVEDVIILESAKSRRGRISPSDARRDDIG